MKVGWWQWGGGSEAVAVGVVAVGVEVGWWQWDGGSEVVEVRWW